MKSFLKNLRLYADPFSTPSLVKTMVLLGLVAILTCIAIFPEMFIRQEISFFWWSDYLIDYYSTFLMTTFFYQGGIQFWDFFGQMPHTFFMATHGMFRLPNVLTALSYFIISPFSNNSAECFHQVFTWVYVLTLMLIRLTGIFLLLKRLTDNKWVLTAGSIIAAVLFCGPAFMIGTFYQSFYPLLMYFILSFFMTFRLVYASMALLFMIFSLSQGMVHTCYMYLGIHLFVCASLGWVWFCNKPLAMQWFKDLRRSRQVLWQDGIMLAVLAVIVLGPYFYMQAVCFKDFDYGLAQSRLAHLWGIADYFHKLPLDLANFQDFFRRMFDFTFEPGMSFFLGYMLFFLSVVALAFSRDNRKWIFAVTILLVWLINFPRDGAFWGLEGHWLNVLTNPLKSMVRSYHMASHAIIPYLLVPLAVIGIQSLIDINKTGHSPSNRRFNVVLAVMTLFVAASLAYEPGIVRTYLIGSLALSMLALRMIMVARRPNSRTHAAMILAALMMADIFLSIYQMKSILTYYHIRPHVTSFMPQSTPIVLDYQNPKLFPFVDRLDTYSLDHEPNIWTLRDMSGTFFHMFNQEWMFRPADVYNPRHVSYRHWVGNRVMREYGKQNDQLVFFAPNAIAFSPDGLERIVKDNLSRDVVMVEGDPNLVDDAWPQRPSVVPPEQWVPLAAELKESEQRLLPDHQMLIWEFPVQGKLPDYFMTTAMTQSKMVRFVVQLEPQKFVELSPVQGKLIVPFTFDVQNIKEGKVLVALPENITFVGLKGWLLLKANSGQGITQVWRHTSDQMGINYQAPGDGWVGVQVPYDKKWVVTLDNKRIAFYRINKSFIGFPVTKGEHKILIQYWPHTWLRWGLLLSVLITSIGFMALIVYALRVEQNRGKDQ